MTPPAPITAAFRALDDCDEALRRLDALCCDPGRSPRMAELTDTVNRARRRLASIDDETEAADTVLEHLEHAGGQVGSLQVGCCAADRLPLYNRLLERLTMAQLAVNESVGRDH